MKGGKAAGKSLLGRIHHRHQPQLGPDHRRNRQERPQAPAGHDKIRHIRDVSLDIDADSDNGKQIDNDNTPIHDTEIRVDPNRI